MEWVSVEGGFSAGNHKEGIVEGQCILEEVSMEKVHIHHEEAWDLCGPWERQKESSGGWHAH